MVLFFWCSNFTSFGPESCPAGSVLSIVPQGCCISNDRTPSVTHRISTYLSHSWLSAGGWLTNSAYLLLVCSWGWTTSWPLADLEWPLLGDWVTQLCSTSVSLPGAKRLGQICRPHSQGRHVRLCKGASGVCWFLFQWPIQGMHLSPQSREEPGKARHEGHGWDGVKN